MNVMRDPEYLRKLTSLRDKLVNIREEAGYLFCSGKDCPSFVKGSPVSRRMYG